MCVHVNGTLPFTTKGDFVGAGPIEMFYPKILFVIPTQNEMISMKLTLGIHE